MRPVTVGNKRISDGEPVFIVAEMAFGHDGKLDQGKKIVDAAADGGADAINFHITDLDAYMVPHYGSGEGRVSAGKAENGVFAYLQTITPPHEVFAELAQYARDKNLLISTLCNDRPSLAFAMESIDPDLLMVHPSAVTDLGFLSTMAAAQKPLMVYVGGLMLGEIEQAIVTVTAAGNDQIILQHGFQAYPTAVSENRLRYIETLKRLFGRPVSFGDHTDGGDPLAIQIPILGVALGANVVEKHLVHDRDAEPEDFESALDPASFRTFVEQTRAAESAFGSPFWQPLSPREENYRAVARKRAVAARDITAGQPVQADDIVFKRSDAGLYPEVIQHMYGRRAVRDIAANDAVEADLLR